MYHISVVKKHPKHFNFSNIYEWALKQPIRGNSKHLEIKIGHFVTHFTFRRRGERGYWARGNGPRLDLVFIKT
jgi:hypothetical protein